MASLDKIQTSFRLMPDQLKRLARAARKKGISQSAFVEAAVMRDINEIEEALSRGKQFDREERLEQIASKKQPIEGSFGSLTAALQKQNTAAAMAENPALHEQPQVAAPVVVNVGASATNNTDIDRLAAFVANANEIERSMRLQTAVSILKETTTSEEERNTLAARLDEAIARRTNKITPTDGSGSVLSRIARIGFDKLSSLIK